MAKDVIRRNSEIQNQGLPSKLNILFIAKAYHGRTVDTEGIIHNELSEYYYPIKYAEGTNSREWVQCNLETVITAMSKYAEVKEYVEIADNNK